MDVMEDGEILIRFRLGTIPVRHTIRNISNTASIAVDSTAVSESRERLLRI
jgi:hypothetical protein